MKKNIWHSLGHASLVLIYIWIVAEVMTHLEPKFAGRQEILAPVSILSLLVFSVAIVGSLIFGRPVLMYFNGQKNEAVRFLGYTLLWLFLITIIILVVSFL